MAAVSKWQYREVLCQRCMYADKPVYERLIKVNEKTV